MNSDTAIDADAAPAGRHCDSGNARKAAATDAGTARGASLENTASAAARAAESTAVAEAVGPVRVAGCACGELSATVYGEPLSVYACACLECQRATGSAFSYRARYAKDRIVVEGEPRRWRRSSDAGRWVEHCFCGRCGGLLYMEAEALPEAVVISVGAFADPDFAAPGALHRSARRHRWYDPGCRLP
ncbi:GFA family protein [Lysobacter firmicutimachus]|uniref:GFA family protein n=1 Tax=Lysobacter firmicutimachus TaxID=1792846 RepID=A0AAU8N0P6_9GAMM